MPIQLVSAVISLVIGNIIILTIKGFFTKDRVRVIGIVFTVLVIAGIAVMVFNGMKRKGVVKKVTGVELSGDFTKYPDIEFSGAHFGENHSKTMVYGHWDSAKDEYTKTDERPFFEAYEEEKKHGGLPLKDTVTGEEAEPLTVTYNSDNTAVYYHHDNKIFRYDIGNNSYELVCEMPLTKDGKTPWIRTIIVDNAEKNIYFTSSIHGDEDEYHRMYSCNLDTKEVDKIIEEDGWVNDMEVTSDDSAIIYYGSYKIRKYDIASGQIETLLEDAVRDVKGVSGEKIIKVSDDGRFIMYYVGSDHDTPLNSYYYVFIYDTKEHTTEKVIRTDLCEISNVDWAK